MKANEYECAMCERVFITGLSDDEAEKQFNKKFPNEERQSDDKLICDNCYKEKLK